MDKCIFSRLLADKNMKDEGFFCTQSFFTNGYYLSESGLSAVTFLNELHLIILSVHFQTLAITGYKCKPVRPV